MSENVDVRIARVTVDGRGDWVLTIAGTDIRQVLWNDRDLEYGVFPGNAMGHRMIEVGWMPDRRAVYNVPLGSPVARLAAQARAGWSESGEGSWTIPCYPRDLVTG